MESITKRGVCQMRIPLVVLYLTPASGTPFFLLPEGPAVCKSG
jgi:hypothetical protein